MAYYNGEAAQHQHSPEPRSANGLKKRSDAMSVDGYHAKIDYDEETDQFRGEISGLSGGADFYGSSPEELRREFRKSLDVFLEVCKEKESNPADTIQQVQSSDFA